MSFLSLYFLIYLSSPIVEIEKNDYTTQFVKRYNPYLYHQTKDSYIILKDETTSNNMKLKAIPFKIKYSSEADYKLERKSISNRAGFITYEEISDKMDAIVSTGDGLFEKISLGTTIEGRDIWALRNITNSPKPKFRVAGATHGDEAMSYQLVYQFMSDFFDKKNQEPYKTLLQEIQFTWIPMINPDGAVNVDRYNSNGIDLNRNFGFFWERGSSYGLEPFSEPETKAIRNDLLEELYSISFSFHTYGDYINYVWNFSEDDVSDQEEIEYLSGLYFDETDYTVVKGYDWYRTTGDLNDYSYGTTGDIDWTIEVADPLQNKDSIYAKNRDAMLSVFSKYQQGVEGIIKNSDGETLFGAIVLKNKGTLIYSQRDNGYFYRYLEAGSYEGTVFVAGYESQNITFTVTENSKENLNIVISNKVDYLYPILVTETVVDLDPTSNYENILLPKNALFESDNIGFSMNGDGYVVFEIPYFEGDYEIKLNLKSGTMNTLKLYSKNDIDSDSVSIQKNSDGKYIFPQGDRYLKIVESITQINQKTAVIDNILIEKVVIDYCNPNPCLDGEAFKTVCIANENGYSCNCIENLVLDENGVCNCPENLVLDENGVCNCPENLVLDENGVCNCPENLVLDENGVCNCPENLVLDENGVCISQKKSNNSDSSCSFSINNNKTHLQTTLILFFIIISLFSIRKLKNQK